MDTKLLDISNYNSSFSLTNKLSRLLWNGAYWIIFRPFSLNVFTSWRAGVLRLFGAKIGKNVNIYSSARIWAPWNLEVGNYSSFGPGVDCYNQGKISIGENCVISQKTYLCASTHDFTNSDFPLVLRPIHIEDQVWVAADAFIGPGVSIGKGAVVGARAAVFKDVERLSVVGGNPARYIKKRIVSDNPTYHLTKEK